jgi:Ser/Thr protein kinase RdoA (MazF antagonist)
MEDFPEEQASHPYHRLTPDSVIDAVESLGLLSDARIFPLNSYENRVYQVGIEEAPPLIAKFYRPNRWTTEQILEEHQFTYELADAALPVVKPLMYNNQTLHQFDEFKFALFPRQGGRMPEPGHLHQLFRMGQFLGRMHAVGAAKPFIHRPILDINEWGLGSREFLLTTQSLPAYLLKAYAQISEELINCMNDLWRDDFKPIRLHGDCHMGNILWRDDHPHFVDFDDARSGMMMQDIWLLISGNRYEKCTQLEEIVEGYNEFNDFPLSQLSQIEILRTLRIMNYSAWLARRWTDPAFPHHFPWFNTEKYWGEHILELKEQLSALQEPSLTLIR